MAVRAKRYLLSARISRAEGMEGHALAGDDRLHKYFPDERSERDAAFTEILSVLLSGNLADSISNPLA